MTRVGPIAAIRAGLRVFLSRFPLLMGVWLLILGLNQLIGWVIPARFYLAAFAAQVMIFGPLYVGQFFVTLQVIRGKEAGIGGLLEGFNRWGAVVGLYLLFYFTIAILLSLSMGFSDPVAFPVALAIGVVVAVAIGLTFAFVPILLVDRKHPETPMSISRALRVGMELTRRRRWTLFAVVLLLSLPIVVVLSADAIAFHAFAITIPGWIITLLSVVCGALFVGPVSTASIAVVYEVALSDHLGHQAASDVEGGASPPRE